MKRIILLIILTLSSFISFSQPEVKNKMAMLIISYHGDSTAFREKYEIDFNRKKVFSFTAHASYLHIKGEKLRTRVRLTRKEWKAVAELGLKIDFEKLSPCVQTAEQKSAWFVERISVDGESLTLQLCQENSPLELRTLFDMIRNSR